MSLSPGKRSGGIRIVEIIETDKRSSSTAACDATPLATASACSFDEEINEQQQESTSTSTSTSTLSSPSNNQPSKAVVDPDIVTPQPWTCISCTFVNPEGRGRFCSMCGTSKAWTCSSCNFQNTLGKFCSMCGSERGGGGGGGTSTTGSSGDGRTTTQTVSTTNISPQPNSTNNDIDDKSHNEQATETSTGSDPIPPSYSPTTTTITTPTLDPAPDPDPDPDHVAVPPKDEDGASSSPSTNNEETTSETIVTKPSPLETEESAKPKLEDSKVEEVVAVHEAANSHVSVKSTEIAKEDDANELRGAEEDEVEKEAKYECRPNEDVPATVETATLSSEDSSTGPISAIPAFSENQEEEIQPQQRQHPSSTSLPDISTGEGQETSEVAAQAKEKVETGETTTLTSIATAAIHEAVVDDESQSSNLPSWIEQQQGGGGGGETEASLSALDDLLVPASPKQSPISSPKQRRKAADTNYYIKSPVRSPVRSPEVKKKQKAMTATTSKRSSDPSSPSPSQQKPQKSLMDLRYILKRHEKPKETNQSNTEVDFYGSMSAIPFLKTPKKEKKKKGKRPKKKASFDEKEGIKSPREKGDDLKGLGEKNSNGVVIIKDYTDEDLKLWKSMSALDTGDIAGERPPDMLPLRPMPKAKKEKPPVDMIKHAERAANRPDEWLHPQDQPQEQWSSPSPRIKVKKEIEPRQEIEADDEANGLQSTPHF